MSWGAPQLLLNCAAARRNKLRALGKQSRTYHPTRAFSCSGMDALLGDVPMTTFSFRNYYFDQIEATRELLRPIQSNKDTPCALEKSLIREIEVRHENLQAVYVELDELGLGMILQNESGIRGL